jgi:hypothetical protein
MMEKLTQRGADIVREAQARAVRSVAQQLRAELRGASIDIQDTQVLARGRGLIARWLSDPRLRFLARGPK